MTQIIVVWNFILGHVDVFSLNIDTTLSIFGMSRVGFNPKLLLKVFI